MAVYKSSGFQYFGKRRYFGLPQDTKNFWANKCCCKLEPLECSDTVVIDGVEYPPVLKYPTPVRLPWSANADPVGDVLNYVWESEWPGFKLHENYREYFARDGAVPVWRLVTRNVRGRGGVSDAYEFDRNTGNPIRPDTPFSISGNYNNNDFSNNERFDIEIGWGVPNGNSFYQVKWCDNREYEISLIRLNPVTWEAEEYHYIPCPGFYEGPMVISNIGDEFIFTYNFGGGPGPAIEKSSGLVIDTINSSQFDLPGRDLRYTTEVIPDDGPFGGDYGLARFYNVFGEEVHSQKYRRASLYYDVPAGNRAAIIMNDLSVIMYEATSGRYTSRIWRNEDLVYQGNTPQQTASIHGYEGPQLYTKPNPGVYPSTLTLFRMDGTQIGDTLNYSSIFQSSIVSNFFLNGDTDIEGNLYLSSIRRQGVDGAVAYGRPGKWIAPLQTGEFAPSIMPRVVCYPTNGNLIAVQADGSTGDAEMDLVTDDATLAITKRRLLGIPPPANAVGTAFRTRFIRSFGNEIWILI